jgi:hypothetical protein
MSKLIDIKFKWVKEALNFSDNNDIFKKVEYIGLHNSNRPHTCEGCSMKIIDKFNTHKYKNKQTGKIFYFIRACHTKYEKLKHDYDYDDDNNFDIFDEETDNLSSNTINNNITTTYISKKEELFGKEMARVNNSTIHQCDINNLANIHEYPHNNKTNKRHVNDLKKAYKKGEYVYGNFVVGIDDNNIPWLLEGHHRIKAIKEIKDKINADAIIYVHKIDNIDSNDTTELYNKINHIKPLRNNAHIKKLATKFVRQFDEKFESILKNKNKDDKVNRPYINKNELSDTITKYIEQKGGLNIDIKKMIENISEKNEKLCNYEYKELISHKKWNKVTETTFNKMDKKECFLSLYSIDELLE